MAKTRCFLARAPPGVFRPPACIGTLKKPPAFPPDVRTLPSTRFSGNRQKFSPLPPW